MTSYEKFVENFPKRTTAPTPDNIYYKKSSHGGVNPCILGQPSFAPGSVLSNCVGYAWGRAAEIYAAATGQREPPALPDSKGVPTANKWFARAHAAGWKTGNEARVGAIICWDNRLDGKDNAGHLAVVESVNDDGTISVSDSYWQDAAFNPPSRRVLSLLRQPTLDSTVGNIKGYQVAYCTDSWKPENLRKRFQGFIYIVETAFSADAPTGSLPTEVPSSPEPVGDYGFTIRTDFPGGDPSGTTKNDKPPEMGGLGKDGGRTKKLVLKAINSSAATTIYQGETIKDFKSVYCGYPEGSNPLKVYPCYTGGSRKPFVGNCPAYVWGRVLEIATQLSKRNNPKIDVESIKSKLPICDGGTMWWNTAKRNGMDTGDEPLPGAVVCNRGQHVAIIEKVNPDGTVAVTQASYDIDGFIGSRTDAYGFIFSYRERCSYNVSAKTLKMPPLFNKSESIHGYVYPFGEAVHRALLPTTSFAPGNKYSKVKVWIKDDKEDSGYRWASGILKIYYNKCWNNVNLKLFTKEKKEKTKSGTEGDLRWLSAVTSTLSWRSADTGSLSDSIEQFLTANCVRMFASTKGSPVRICTDGSDGTLDKDSYWQGQTAATMLEGPNKGKYLDAYRLPYVVQPLGESSLLYKKAIVVNRSTNMYITAVVGDRGPTKNGWGEISLYALRKTGHPNHTNGNWAPDDDYEVYLVTDNGGYAEIGSEDAFWVTYPDVNEKF